jgi:predicted metalloprotease with PDZ domain
MIPSAHHRLVIAALAVALGGVAFDGHADNLPEPADRPYLGPITISVDATDLDHRMVRVRETVPAAPGPLVLLYPRWIPGWHGPGGNVVQLAGLRIAAGGRTLPWKRDETQTEAFRVEVPAGATAVDIEFQHLSPVGGAAGRVAIGSEQLNLDWTRLVLYPAGHWLSALRGRAVVTLPMGFEAATALRPTSTQGQTIGYAEESLETLFDSPVFAGRHHRRVELDAPDAPRPVAMHLFADAASDLEAKPEMLEAHRELVRQADRLFGSRHYRHYDLLLLQSKELGAIGLEHHESSENGVKPGYFKDWGKGIKARQLLAHEYTHSWNGKFRRPADLWTPNLNVPMRDSLLWLYEGQTEYWGRVLASRSGLVTAEEAQDQLARSMAFRTAMPGRAWRSLQDTTSDPLLPDGERPWYDYQRGWDYYDEMALVWLDVDTLIRERSADRRSLDDFARAFFGVEHGRVAPLTYRFEDIAAALNEVEPYDWTTMLRERLDRVGDGRYLLDALARSGWRLEWDEKESELARNAREADEGGPPARFYWSIGVDIGKDGKLDNVRWDGPAWRAGLAPGQRVMAVDGLAYNRERLEAAITAAKGKGPAVSLLVKDGERFRTVSIEDHGGLRYPKLARIDGLPDRLSAILSPRPR